MSAIRVPLLLKTSTFSDRDSAKTLSIICLLLDKAKIENNFYIE